jgi:hypothetical protein
MRIDAYAAPDARRAAALPTPAAQGAPARRERALFAGVALLVAATFVAGRSGAYRSGDAVGYNLGLAGGIMMLLLLGYPLRKHVAALRGFGPARIWFAGHMALGIGGPLLVLAHTTWHVGSTNALVALASMLVVAASGLVGRFVYVRIHRGLYGERATLRELQATAGFDAERVRSNLDFAPSVEARIRAFEARALPRCESWLDDAARFVTLGVRRRLTALRYRPDLRAALRERASRRGWDRTKYRRRRAAVEALVDDYLATLQRVSQFAVYERIFSLWHMLHVPLVYLLALAALAHVVAVHLY